MIMKYFIGQKVEVKRHFASEEVSIFANISEDKNPVHLDERKAKSMGFERKIVHGILAVGTFSFLIANSLPGPGNVYLHQI